MMCRFIPLLTFVLLAIWASLATLQWRLTYHQLIELEGRNETLYEEVGNFAVHQLEDNRCYFWEIKGGIQFEVEFQQRCDNRGLPDTLDLIRSKTLDLVGMAYDHALMPRHLTEWSAEIQAILLAHHPAGYGVSLAEWLAIDWPATPAQQVLLLARWEQSVLDLLCQTLHHDFQYGQLS